MTREPVPMPRPVTYAQHLQEQIAKPGVLICGGPPVADWPAWYEDLFPFLKDPGIRALEARARAATRAALRPDREKEAG